MSLNRLEQTYLWGSLMADCGLELTISRPHHASDYVMWVKDPLTGERLVTRGVSYSWCMEQLWKRCKDEMPHVKEYLEQGASK